MILFPLSLKAQTLSFDNLNANAGNTKEIIWFTSSFGNGFGHKIYNVDPGNATNLRIAGRHNSAIWNDIMTLTSNGNVGFGTTNPGSRLHIDGGDIWLTSANFRFTTANQGIMFYGTGERIIGTANYGIDLQTNGGTSRLFVANNGNIGVGTTTPQSRFDVLNTNPLGTTLGNNLLLTRISANNGTNNFMNNLWLYRDASNDNGWTSVRLHDAISIDGEFLTPQTNTRTWWERQPNKDIQSWGTGATAYLTINQGNIQIGTFNSYGSYKLAVAGKIAAWQEVRVFGLNSTNLPDYVFEPTYRLRPLSEIDTYVKEHKHLPEVPSAKEMEKDGMGLMEMNTLLLKKVEELTLYLIEQRKEMDQLKQKVINLEKNTSENSSIKIK